ncbi:MAG: chloride channel protein, partial [Eubacterium sp.]|nr:chloride channel protein [Eubacterium sp.]
EFGTYAPLFLIVVALLKCLLTTCSIQFGFRGGHFFPLIFACVCGGFGVCMLLFGDGASSHVVFAAAVVTAATLGAQMKKPAAVTMLLMLMFPVRMLLPILLAAALGGIVGGSISQEEVADPEL